MASKKSDLLGDAWENMGIAFAVNKSKTRNADPERTLLASLGEFGEDRKLLKLVLVWLAEYGDLIHVERVKALAADLSTKELAWLGSVAAIQKGDRRWSSVVESVKKRLGRFPPKHQMSQLDLLQAERSGADQNFLEFGLTIPVFEAAEPKKVRARAKTLEDNLWLRMRVLFGSNWRADVATLMLLEQAQTSYQVAQLLGCSGETAYRNLNSLREAGLVRLLKSVA
jgi:hypothetical protein